jgi:4-carboxymuconolactone decarboxylase
MDIEWLPIVGHPDEEAAMRHWIKVTVVVWAGFGPVAAQVDRAGALPADVHPVSRSRLPPIQREELDPARRAAYDDAKRDGSAGVLMGAAALRLHGSGTDLRFSGPLGRRLTELAILTTAREHDQPYEWALHELDALAVGLDEVLIDIVRHRKPLTGVGDPEAIIIEVGRELFTTHRLGPDTYARALARLGKTNLVDLIDLMGNYASTAATLTAFNQQMPSGWRQSLPLPFTHPNDIHADSRSRLPLRAGPYRTSVSALYGRMASPGGLGPGQIRAYGEGLQTLAARVGERTTMLTILVTARAHDSQYDWTVHEPKARAAGLEPAVIDTIRHRRPLAGLGEKDAALVALARELFGDHNVGAETYARAARAFDRRDLVDLVGLMGAHAADAAVLAAFDQQLPAGVEPLLPVP